MIGTTVPKVAAREGRAALARVAASEIEIRQQFRRIKESSNVTI
jgi:hypothetical protein